MDIAQAIKEIRCSRYNECDLPNCHGIMEKKKGSWSVTNEDGKEEKIIMYQCSKCGRLYSRNLKLDHDVKEIQDHWEEEQSRIAQQKRELIVMEKIDGDKHIIDRW